MAWRRWLASAASMGSGESVKIAVRREAVWFEWR
jgi:hypothetical protein